MVKKSKIKNKQICSKCENDFSFSLGPTEYDNCPGCGKLFCGYCRIAAVTRFLLDGKVRLHIGVKPSFCVECWSKYKNKMHA